MLQQVTGSHVLRGGKRGEEEGERGKERGGGGGEKGTGGGGEEEGRREGRTEHMYI